MSAPNSSALSVRRACARRRGSAGADCRRRHGRRWRRRAVFRTVRASGAARRAGGARDGAVHAVIVGRDAPTAGKAALRPAQKASRSASSFEIRQVVDRAIGDRDRAVIRWSHSAGAIELDDQQRLDIERIADLDEGLGGVDRGTVHHLHAAGMMPAAMTSATHWPALSTSGSRSAARGRSRASRQDAHGHFGDDAEQPFRADDDAQQIVARRIERPAADAHHLARSSAQSRRRARCWWSARISGSARRRNSRRHCRRSCRRSGWTDRGRNRSPHPRPPGDGEVGDAGLHHGDAVVIVDIEDAVEPRHAEQHRIGERQRTARQRCARNRAAPP
jgi:hypothetical protein